MMNMEYEKMDTSFETIFGEVQVIENKPEGTIEITENGLHDVSEYANAEVNVIGDGGITPTGTKEIVENGEYDVATYEKANVNVPIPDGYIQPAGTLAITENGKYDVTQYAEAEVTIEASGGVDMISYASTLREVFYGVDFSENPNITIVLKNFSKGDIYNSFSKCTNVETIKLVYKGERKDCLAQLAFSYANSVKGIDLSEFNVTFTGKANNMFDSCKALVEIKGELDFSGATSMNNIFSLCNALEEVRFKESSIPANLYLGTHTMLSDESIQSIINGLATVETTQTLTLHANVKAKLTDTQIATITSKNWNLA